MYLICRFIFFLTDLAHSLRDLKTAIKQSNLDVSMYAHFDICAEYLFISCDQCMVDKKYRRIAVKKKINMEAQMKINQRTYKIKEIIVHDIMAYAVFLHTNCMKNITGE